MPYAGRLIGVPRERVLYDVANLRKCFEADAARRVAALRREIFQVVEK